MITMAGALISDLSRAWAQHIYSPNPQEIFKKHDPSWTTVGPGRVNWAQLFPWLCMKFWTQFFEIYWNTKMCSRSSSKSIGFLFTLTLTISRMNCCKVTSPVFTIKSNMIESFKLLNLPCFVSLKFKTWLWILLYKPMYVNKNAFYVYFVESGEAGALSIERFSCAMLFLWSVFFSDTAIFLLDIQSFFNIEVLAWGANGHQFFAPLWLWFVNKLYFQYILLFLLKLIYIIDM